MIVDHVTFLYFPDFTLGRIIGRFCAPIFFYELAVGYSRTTDLRIYLQRMIVWAFIAQFFIYLLVGFETHPQLNILFTFAWCLISLYLFNQQQNLFNKIIVLLCCLFLASFFHFSYGWYAVVCVFLFYFYEETIEWKILWAIVTLLTVYDSSITCLQIFAVFAPYVIFALRKVSLQLPRLNFYFLYVLQWVLLSLPALFM